jgi:hypothetical protein
VVRFTPLTYFAMMKEIRTMNTLSRPGPLCIRVAGCATLVALILVCQAPAGPLIEYTGYTRPANVELKDSKPLPKVVPIQPGKRKSKEIGGTIYFMVLDRAKGTDTDPWGTGLKDFSTRFLASRDTPNGKLDTRARYLYLYQVVNDSGADGYVYRASVRLLIDPRLITSWGHFRGEDKTKTLGVSFSMPFAGKKGEESKILPVAAPPERQGVSNRQYRPRAPYHLAPKLYSLSNILLVRGGSRR